MDQKHSNAPVIVVISLFFMWGFITVLVDSLIPRLREVFELSYFQAGAVQVAFFSAYFLVSIPAGFLLARIGYKRGMLIGLATMGIGCLLFWPAASTRVYPYFMLAIFTLAAGMTVLQVAANPYVAVLGSEEGASSRLNLAQAFNSVGTTIAPIVGANYLLSDHILDGKAIEALSVTDALLIWSRSFRCTRTFRCLAVALLLLAIIVGAVHLPRILDGEVFGSYKTAFQKGRLSRGAVGIFLYVGAEVAIGSYLVNYFLSMDLAEAVRANSTMRWIAELLGTNVMEMDAKGVVGVFVALFWGGAMIGRFVGSILTRIYRPAMVLMVFGLLAISMILVSISTSGFVSMWSILAVGLFNSIMFPLFSFWPLKVLGRLNSRLRYIMYGHFRRSCNPPSLDFWLMIRLQNSIPTCALLLLLHHIYAWNERRTT